MMDTVQPLPALYLTAAASLRYELNQFKHRRHLYWIVPTHALAMLSLAPLGCVELVTKVAFSILLCLPNYMLRQTGYGAELSAFYERHISIFTDRGIAFSLCLISPIILTNFIVLPPERKDLLGGSSEMSSTDALKNFLYKKIHNPSSSPQEENTHFSTFQRLLLR